MQGFNRYIPPDYDPKQHSTLNSRQGKKHALGKRAKDIDSGVLVVRFELPYNIWCGTCNAHLGAGVRYNAQKRKVGAYYSTPIYAFRCKCHLCSGWFEIRTDPKNAAYVVQEGARRKEEDWDPEENGGYRAHDTEAPSAADASADPFAHVEKTIDQETWKKAGTSRITQLSQHSDRMSSDPYAVSVALRRKFREEKAGLLEKQGRDDSLREKYGLAADVDLGIEEVEGGEGWKEGRRERGLSLGGGGEGSSRSVRGVERVRTGALGKGKGRASDPYPSASLAETLRRTTKKKYDPFGSAGSAFASPSSVGSTPTKGLLEGMKVKGKIKEPSATAVGMPKSTPPSAVASPAAISLDGEGLGGGLLSGYASD
ncbi:hypothetical protein IAT38_001424 [Cryptococcus sp. DSM 104549]